MTTKNKDISFSIDHIDPLGQGVFKQDDQIYFIPKTLPKEQGIATIYKNSKNVNFANLVSLKTKSQNRVSPECPHFDNCNGCSYLHTSYNEEIEYKRLTFERMASFDFPNHPPIKIEQAPRRFKYRNRIQLHYNLDKIGFINPRTKEIVDVSHCLMPSENLKQAFDLFLQTWKDQRASKTNLKNGHVELYERENEIKISWNNPYSDGGFTQVFDEMNERLNSILKRELINSTFVLDLFGGNGNLSKSASNKAIIDYYENNFEIKENQFHIDLYKEDAISRIKSLNFPKNKTLIIDPPRKGFSPLAQLVNLLEPDKIIYVSCNSSTMFRDIKKLKFEYKLDQIHMLDLFPSTYHFEGLLVLQRII